MTQEIWCHKGTYRSAKEKKKIVNSSVVQFSYCKKKLTAFNDRVVSHYK